VSDSKPRSTPFVETALLVLAAGGAIAALVLPRVAPAASLLLVGAAGVNLLARRQLERRSRRRADSLQRQLREHHQLLDTLANRAAAATAPVPPRLGDTDTAVVRDHLASVERTLTQVVQYLNQSAFPARVGRVETELARLRADLSQPPRDASRPAIAPQQFDATPPPVPAPARPPVTAPTWTSQHRLAPHADTVAAIALSETQILSVSWDGNFALARCHDPAATTVTTATAQGLRAALLNDDGTIAVTGGFDRTVTLWYLHADGPECSAQLDEHRGSIRALVAACDRASFFSGGHDGLLARWDWSGQLLDRRQDPSGAIAAIAVSPDGQWLASAGSAGTVTLWDARHPERYLHLRNAQTVESLAISPDSRAIAAGCIDGTVRIWQLLPDLAAQQQALDPAIAISGRGGQVHALQFLPTGDWLLAGSADGTIRCWHLASGRQTEPLHLGSPPVSVTALAVRARTVAVGGADGTLALWEVAT